MAKRSPSSRMGEREAEVDYATYARTPISKTELFAAVHHEMNALLATPVEMELALSTLPLRRSAAQAAEEVFMTEVRFTLPLTTGTSIWFRESVMKEIGRLRQQAIAAKIDYEAAKRAQWHWANAGAQACVMLERRGLPKGVVDAVRGYLHPMEAEDL